ncbi:hypothetical protein AOLI_G00283200 [Acnodon oligacanthus]
MVWRDIITTNHQEEESGLVAPGLALSSRSSGRVALASDKSQGVCRDARGRGWRRVSQVQGVLLSVFSPRSARLMMGDDCVFINQRRQKDGTARGDWTEITKPGWQISNNFRPLRGGSSRQGYLNAEP